jgi:hypothetical protein
MKQSGNNQETIRKQSGNNKETIRDREEREISDFKATYMMYQGLSHNPERVNRVAAENNYYLKNVLPWLGRIETEKPETEVVEYFLSKTIDRTRSYAVNEVSDEIDANNPNLVDEYIKLNKPEIEKVVNEIKGAFRYGENQTFAEFFTQNAPLIFQNLLYYYPQYNTYNTEAENQNSQEFREFMNDQKIIEKMVEKISQKLGNLDPIELWEQKQADEKAAKEYKEWLEENDHIAPHAHRR